MGGAKLNWNYIKFTKQIITSGIVGYSLVMVYVALFQNNWIYHPYPTTELDDPWVPIHGSQGIIAASYGPLLPNKKTAILFHGNGSTIQDKAWYKNYVPHYNLIVFEYPGYGMRYHETLNKTNIMKEARVLLKTVAKTDLLIGESLGSGIAMELGYEYEIPHIVLVTPYERLLDLAKQKMPYLPVSWLLTEDYETLRFAEKYGGSLTIITAGKDTIIPVASLQSLLKIQSQHIHLPEAEHNNWNMYHTTPFDIPST